MLGLSTVKEQLTGSRSGEYERERGLSSLSTESSLGPAAPAGGGAAHRPSPLSKQQQDQAGALTEAWGGCGGMLLIQQPGPSSDPAGLRTRAAGAWHRHR